MKPRASIPHVCSVPARYVSVLVMFALIACSPAAATPPPVTPTLPQASPEPVILPLSERGPYSVGRRLFRFEDASRENREVGVTVWYPAVRPADSTGSGPIPDAASDISGAPYPLILSSTKVGNIFATHLVSHGFVVAGINDADSADLWGLWLLDYPLDIVFMLDQIASQPLDGLEGVIDANHAGAMGYSFDGYDALALGGARVDPEFYLAQCAQAPRLRPPLPEWWVKYICDMAGDWEEFAAHAGEAITTSDDGLWQPMTDERIRAVMPMAPEGAWLFGERGLSAVDRPTLIIGATEDDINLYDQEAAYIFEHLGTPDRAMISFVGKGHMMIFNTDPVTYMKHLAAAFFGYYLQERDDYATYFSEDFVAQHDELAWGVYSGE